MSKAKNLFGAGDRAGQPQEEFSVKARNIVTLMSPLKFKMSFAMT